MSLIITNVATITTQSRIKEEMITFTLQNFASSQRLKNVLKNKNASVLTIELRDSITKISIRRNSVIFIQTKLRPATMENTAPLLTPLKISKFVLFTICSLKTKTTTSLSLTLRLNGARSIMTIIKLNAFTHTTSKTSEENLICSSMRLSFVKTGKVGLLSPAIKRGAKGLSSALTLMGGRSNNFTLLFIRLNPVRKSNVLKGLNALTSTALKIKE